MKTDPWTQHNESLPGEDCDCLEGCRRCHPSKFTDATNPFNEASRLAADYLSIVCIKHLGRDRTCTICLRLGDIQDALLKGGLVVIERELVERLVAALRMHTRCRAPGSGDVVEVHDALDAVKAAGFGKVGS